MNERAAEDSFGNDDFIMYYLASCKGGGSGGVKGDMHFRFKGCL